MTMSPLLHMRERSGEKGVSLLEAIVGLVVASMLLTTLSAMMINVHGVQSRLERNFADNRDDIFLERQLRFLFSRTVNQPGKAGKKIRFEGDRTEINALAIGGFLTHESPTEFRLAVLDDDGENSAALSIDIEGEEYPIHIYRLAQPVTFSYLDHHGRSHDKWPPSNQNTELLNQNRGTLTRSELPNAVIVASDDQSDPPGRTLVLRLGGERIYPGDKK